MDIYDQIGRNLWLSRHKVKEADVMTDEVGREFIWVEEEDSGFAVIRNRLYLPTVDKSQQP